MKKGIKKNYKILVGIIIGIAITGTTVYGANILSSKDVVYSNTTSNLSSTNVQDAIDEVSSKLVKYKNYSEEINTLSNIVYRYNQTGGASNYCITGEEETCEVSTCFYNKTANSCKAGDIIKYKVNDTDIITFHVMYDNGATLTMQSQKNIINNTAWYADSRDNTNGPITILSALENATSNWTNVNTQTYTMGETVFKTNAYTGCDNSADCNVNVYTLDSRMARARMITVQESQSFGCTQDGKSCPIWMYNYLKHSGSYGGTIDDMESSDGYWTMNGSSVVKDVAFYVLDSGRIFAYNAINDAVYGARAVVTINK